MSDGVAGSPAAGAVLFARELKEALVRHPLRDNEMFPTLIVSRGGELFAVCDLRQCWADRCNVVREAVAVLSPDEAALFAESVIALAPPGKGTDPPPPEALHGGDPALTAAIDLLYVSSIGDEVRVLLPYDYLEGRLEWDEARHVASPAEPIGTAKLEAARGPLRAGFDAPPKRFELEGARAALKALGVRVRVTEDPDPFVNVGTDEPCPCGSNLTFKDCHGYVA